MSLLIAVQLYSVRDEANQDLRSTLESIKNMGYDGIELAGLCGQRPEDIRAMCEEIGLTPVSAHVSYSDMVADIEILNKYVTIGCNYVAVPYLEDKDRPNTPEFANVIKNIKTIGRRAKALGMVLLYHNHHFEFVKLDGRYALDVLYDSVDRDLLQTEIDTCWVKVAGEDPAEYVRKYAGRCPVVHLKDMNDGVHDGVYELAGTDKPTGENVKAFEFRPVGSGIQDIPELLRAAEESGASWVVVEQDAPSMGLTPMESIKRSRENLKKLGY